MPKWTEQPVSCGGSVLFRGTMPPRIENFEQLAKAGASVRKHPPNADAHWSAEVAVPQWGTVTVLCLRDYAPVPPVLVEYDPRLTPEDRKAALAAGSWINIKMEGAQKNILRDRKIFLRFLRLFLGTDGLITMDHLAQRFWTREALDEELQHDAEVDVEALFITHAISEDDTVEQSPESDEQKRCIWLHTHGLADLGTFDFDIMRPSPMLIGSGYDCVRALAYTLLEEGPAIANQTVPVFTPGGECTLVPVAEFNRSAPAADRAPRGDPADPTHNEGRVICCDPVKKRFFGLGASIRASRALSTINTDHMMSQFPSAATTIMARRARQTYLLFASFAKEFAEFDAKPLAKIGYPVDGTNPADNDCEHMWFEVHRFGKDCVEATLLNQPFNIAKLKEGDKGVHALERLTDWAIFTPAGQINPRSMLTARILRTHASEIRKAMAQHKNQL